MKHFDKAGDAPSESGYSELERWYATEYENVYHSRGMDFLYRFVYRFMERPNRQSKKARVLELGAGNGNYRRLAKPDYLEYFELDLRAWPDEMVSAVQKVEGDACNLEQFPDNSFDRALATCVLVHLEKPKEALEEWRRVVKPGGSITIYVPPEAGLAITLLRKFLVWPPIARLGFRPRVLASLDHRYSYFFMDALIHEVFRRHTVRRRTFPFRALEYHFAFFHSYQITLAPE